MVNRHKTEPEAGAESSSQLNIRLPWALMRALHADAERCKRSNTKQVEAILEAYYELGDVNVRDPRAIRARVAQTSAHNNDYREFLEQSLAKLRRDRETAEGEYADFLDRSIEKLEQDLKETRKLRA